MELLLLWNLQVARNLVPFHAHNICDTTSKRSNLDVEANWSWNTHALYPHVGPGTWILPHHCRCQFHATLIGPSFLLCNWEESIWATSRLCARGHELLYLHLHSVDWRAHLGLALPRAGSAMSLAAAAVACAQFLPPHPSSRLKDLTGADKCINSESPFTVGLLVLPGIMWCNFKWKEDRGNGKDLQTSE